MRKNLYISTLLFILLCPLWLAYLFFSWQKHLAKEQAKWLLLSGLDTTELITLKFSKTDAAALLQWDGRHEFEYKGEMYDVAEEVEEGDSIRYRCYWDQPESQLNQQLERLLAEATKDNPANTNHTERLIHFYQSLFQVEPLYWRTSIEQQPEACFAYLFTIGQLAPPPTTPPPNV